MKVNGDLEGLYSVDFIASIIENEGENFCEFIRDAWKHLRRKEENGRRQTI